MKNYKDIIFELMLSRSQDNKVSITCLELMSITGLSRHYCLKAVLELEVQHGKIRRSGINSTTYEILDRSPELLDLPMPIVLPKKLFVKKKKASKKVEVKEVPPLPVKVEPVKPVVKKATKPTSRILDLDRLDDDFWFDHEEFGKEISYKYESHKKTNSI